jgi:alcohol dehydrogenase class IV
MKPFALARIPEILFGAGRLADLGKQASSLAGPDWPVLLVADPALEKAGITARAMASLSAAGHQAVIYDSLRGEPKASDVDKAAELARRHEARLVVGLGGGSALDTAKLVASCAASGLPVTNYQLAKVPLPPNHLPIIAVPTTAGTGSEVTRVAVFANDAGDKVWGWGDELKPQVAILDPELTVGVPPAVTAATGLDAMVHAIEACTNRYANPGNDLFCHRAISLIGANLERAVKAPDDLEARAAMLLGSCYGGIAIDNSGTALAHNISHAIADLAPIPHGRATGLAMLATIGWVAEGNPEGFAAVARAMGSADATAGYERLVRATGIKVSLAGDGIDLDRPEALAAHMAAPANAPMRKATLRNPDDAELLMLARRMLALA